MGAVARGRGIRRFVAGTIVLAALAGGEARAQEPATPTGPRPASSGALPGALCVGAEPRGLIVYQATTAGGGQTDELVVVAPDGTELHRATVPDARQIIPTAMPGRALVTTATNRIFLLNAASGEATEIEPPVGGWREIAIPRDRFLMGNGTRFVVLGGFTQTVLVDLQDGEATDLAALTNDPGMGTIGAVIARDDSHAVVSFLDRTYVFPTDDPAAFRPIGGDVFVLGADFSPDAATLIYTQRVGDDRYEVVVERVDGSASTVVATKDQLVSGEFAGSSERVVLHHEDGVSVVDVPTADEHSLISEPVRELTMGPDGRYALVRGANSGNADSVLGDHWAILDLEDGGLDVRPELDGDRLILQPGQSRWLTFADAGFTEAGSDDLPRAMHGVDLTAGEVRQTFTVQPEEDYGAPALAPADMR